MNSNETSYTEKCSVVLIESMYGDSNCVQVNDILYVMANRDNCIVYTIDKKSHEIGDAMAYVNNDWVFYYQTTDGFIHQFKIIN